VGPDQENIVDIAKSDERFERCGVEVLGLQASHEEVGVGRGHASAHDCAFDLQEIVVLKGEVVHGELKLGYLKQKWCTEFTRTGACVEKVFKVSETMGVGNVGIQCCHVDYN